MSRHGDCKVYVGDLGNNASKPELEDAFSYYGPLRNVWIARNPPGFAFVEFEDPRDAEDAVSYFLARFSRICAKIFGRFIMKKPYHATLSSTAKLYLKRIV